MNLLIHMFKIIALIKLPYVFILWPSADKNYLNNVRKAVITANPIANKTVTLLKNDS